MMDDAFIRNDWSSGPVNDQIWISSDPISTVSEEATRMASPIGHASSPISKGPTVRRTGSQSYTLGPR